MMLKIAQELETALLGFQANNMINDFSFGEITENEINVNLLLIPTVKYIKFTTVITKEGVRFG
tara:strand:- start:1594 stop:1782 length:189 start_codon:yes stop_codon:yes gene_type:complete